MIDALVNESIGVNNNELSEDSSQISASDVYNYFLNYFQAVEQLLPFKIQNQYKVLGSFFDEIILGSDPNQKLEIFKHDALCYSAVYHNSRWIELKNELLNNEIEIIRRMPQTKEDVVKEYLTRYLVDHLHKRFNKADVFSQDVTVKFDDSNKEVQLYSFYIDYLPKKNTEIIYGKDSNGSLILKAEIINESTVVFIENEVSDDCLLKFGNWCQE